MAPRLAGALLAGTVLYSAPLAAQTAPMPLLARGDSLYDAVDPKGSLAPYREALALAPERAEVLWRVARSEVDIAKQLLGDDRDVRRTRDSIYAVARDLALRGVAADSLDADAHFVLALVLGQQSRTKSGQDRVQYARRIYDECARALALDPDHAGAHHIIGAWHAEVRRLSGVTRFIAKTFLGAGFMGRASWDSAAVHLERAAELDPTYVFHRLELAEIYVDVERFADARAQLETIPALPERDVLDPLHREAAARLLEELRERP